MLLATVNGWSLSLALSDATAQLYVLFEIPDQFKPAPEADETVMGEVYRSTIMLYGFWLWLLMAPQADYTGNAAPLHGSYVVCVMRSTMTTRFPYSYLPWMVGPGRTSCPAPLGRLRCPFGCECITRTTYMRGFRLAESLQNSGHGQVSAAMSTCIFWTLIRGRVVRAYSSRPGCHAPTHTSRVALKAVA